MSISQDPSSRHSQFLQERERLLKALGELTEGGIVEGLQHIGATGALETEADACLDIGLAVWPFPLEPQPQAALEALGYALVAGYEAAPEQRFLHATGRTQLFLVDAGSTLWTDYLLFRDYLRVDPLAAAKYTQEKRALAIQHQAGSEEYRHAKVPLQEETLAKARQWWIDTTGFASLEEIREELKAFPHEWYISSGWAIDLFLGRVTRVHHDVDVLIPRTDQLALQEYMRDRGWKWVTPWEGQLLPWPPRMRLELPRHQAHAHKDGRFIDFLLADIEGGVWRFRREPTILRAKERLILHSQEGIPCLAPEVVLLFKSRTGGDTKRSKDQEDFDKTAPHLEPERRAWLLWALTVLNPEHPWIPQLR